MSCSGKRDAVAQFVNLASYRFVLHVRIDVKCHRDLRVSYDLLNGLGVDSQPEQVCAKRMSGDVKLHI